MGLKNVPFAFFLLAGVCAVLTTCLAAETSDKDKSNVPIEPINERKAEIKEHLMMMFDVKTGKDTYQTEEEILKVLEMLKKYTSDSLVTRTNSTRRENQTEGSGERNKRDIFGTDNRADITTTSAFPFCGIGQLATGGIGGRGYCTVFLVGRYHAVTAGHCVYNTSTKSFRSSSNSFKVYFGRSCSTYGDAVDVTSIATYAAYRNDADVRYDIALLLLDRRQISTPSKCIIELGYLNTPNAFTATTCGYPYDRSIWYNRYDCMSCGNGLAAMACISRGEQRVCDENLLIHNCDTYSAGMDGGPLLTTTHPGTPEEVAYGINSGWVRLNGGSRFNRATRFSRGMLVDACSWLDANGQGCTIEKASVATPQR